MDSVGEKIKKLRKSRKITQLEMGKALHLANNTISAWETGASSLTVDKLSEVAAFFNVPVSYFINEIEDAYKSEQIRNEYRGFTAEQSMFFTDLMTKALEMDSQQRKKFIDSIKFTVEFFNRHND